MTIYISDLKLLYTVSQSRVAQYSDQYTPLHKANGHKYSKTKKGEWAAISELRKDV